MSSESSGSSSHKLALTFSSLLVRLWLGTRALQTGIEKYAGSKASGGLVTIDGTPNEYGLTAAGATKQYGMEFYHGVPQALMSKFQAEPLMFKWALPLYDKMLGPVFILLGITILLGIANRISLFLLGLLYISLTWGLILIKQDEGVSWLGIHMILVVMGLAMAEYNRFAVLKKW